MRLYELGFVEDTSLIGCTWDSAIWGVIIGFEKDSGNYTFSEYYCDVQYGSLGIL